MTENPFARPQATAGDKWDLKNEGMKWLGSLFLIIVIAARVSRDRVFLLERQSL